MKKSCKNSSLTPAQLRNDHFGRNQDAQLPIRSAVVAPVFFRLADGMAKEAGLTDDERRYMFSFLYEAGLSTAGCWDFCTPRFKDSTPDYRRTIDIPALPDTED
ncbi:MAG: hypothetical protein NTV22_05690 [bacterium]|nr:hypothetical protein [bacterium]